MDSEPHRGSAGLVQQPLQNLPSLSLYLHFPWCVAKCPYCDFNSHSLKGELPASAYVDALLTELAASSAVLSGRPLTSIFMGGGTPSLFPPQEMTRLLNEVRKQFVLAPDIEITMEANPGAIEHAAFAGYREAGINRLSLGVQSFADDKLQALGRIHDAAAARQAYVEARAAGFSNINLDLMYALPQQTLAQAGEDLRQAIELQPEHISYYHLTLEPNTVFYSRPPVLPDDDAAWDIQKQADELLLAGGYENYEVSAWARAGQRCRHNLNYWKFGDYLGLGAGAHGKLTLPDGRVQRERRAAHPRDYQNRVATDTQTTLHEVTEQELIFEFMLNVLRLQDGFSLQEFTEQTFLDKALLLPGLEIALQKQLLSEDRPGHYRPSERGWRFLDDLQAVFLPPD